MAITKGALGIYCFLHTDWVLFETTTHSISQESYPIELSHDQTKLDNVIKNIPELAVN